MQKRFGFIAGVSEQMKHTLIVAVADPVSEQKMLEHAHCFVAERTLESHGPVDAHGVCSM